MCHNLDNGYKWDPWEHTPPRRREAASRLTYKTTKIMLFRLAPLTCAFKWSKADKETYSTSSTVCWNVNSQPFNYHCHSTSLCKRALIDPTGESSGWSQGGQPCKEAPVQCMVDGQRCKTSVQCCPGLRCVGRNCTNNIPIDYQIFRF